MVRTVVTLACHRLCPAAVAVAPTVVETLWVVLAWRVRVVLVTPLAAAAAVRVDPVPTRLAVLVVWVHNARVARVPKTAAKPAWVARVVVLWEQVLQGRTCLAQGLVAQDLRQTSRAHLLSTVQAALLTVRLAQRPVRAQPQMVTHAMQTTSWPLAMV
jgi:hypothetical protein